METFSCSATVVRRNDDYLKPVHMLTTGKARNSMSGMVTAVARSATHTLSKPNAGGLGVESDAHLGVTVKHRSRVGRAQAGPICARST